MNYGMDEFQNAHFTVNNITLDMTRYAGGYYYPIRDSCDRLLDDKEGCIYTKALYYQKMIGRGDDNTYITVQISTDGVNLQTITAITSYRDLYCKGDSDSKYDNCDNECREVNGELIGNNILNN